MGRRREELIERARHVPKVRDLDENSLVVQKAAGSRLYDVDNVGYIDYVGSRGSAIVGYANQYISDAVKKVLANGLPTGMHSPLEIDLAESLAHFLPWVGSWVFCRNQDDAMRRALDWACRATGKNQILCLEGGERFDACPSAESGRVTPTLRRVPGWDVDKIEAAIAAGGSKLAAMVIDPVMSGAGVVPAPEGVVLEICDACRRSGVVVVLDERVAGFRVARGGGAERAGIVPDVAVYGGALAGGLPLGAVAFAKAVDEPEADTWGADRDLPHPAALAAADAVLSIIRNESVFSRLDERAQQLVDGMRALADRFSRRLQLNQQGSVFALYCADAPVNGLAAAQAADGDAYHRLVDGLRAEGVYLPPKHQNPAFVSSAHGAKEIDESLAAFERVLMRLHQEDLP